MKVSGPLALVVLALLTVAVLASVLLWPISTVGGPLVTAVFVLAFGVAFYDLVVKRFSARD
jgi:hypothetical protein